MAKTLWHGVYPAATTQFAADLSLDMPACRKTLTALVADGVDGLVLLGTVGENNSLRPEEKRLALRAAVEAVGGRVPLVAGVSELTTERAIEFARDAEKIGIDALMLLPAMVYVPTPDELYAHFRAVAEATALPIMLYNNPPAYRVIDRDRDARAARADSRTSSRSRKARRIRAASPTSSTASAIATRCSRVSTTWRSKACCWARSGWVSGLTSAFPRESVAMVAAVRARRLDRSAAHLSLVHAAAAPRCRPRSGAVHQAGRTDHGPRLGTRAHAAPAARAARAAPT